MLWKKSKGALKTDWKCFGKSKECFGSSHFDQSISKQCYRVSVSAAKIIPIYHPLLFRGGSLPQARAFISALGINCLESSNTSIMGFSICESSKVNLPVMFHVMCVSEKHEIISRGGFGLCFALCHNAE